MSKPEKEDSAILSVNNMEEKETKNSSDKLGTEPIGKLLFSMSIPPILGIVVLSIYNLTDSIYISRLSSSEKALTALSLSFPIQALMTAFSIGIGMGTSILISKFLGERNRDLASKTAKNGLFLAIINVIVFVFCGLFYSEKYITLFTNDFEIIEMGKSYLTIVTVFAFGIFIEGMLCRILQGTGDMKSPMISQLLGAIVNIIFDPLLIYGIWIFPELGFKGAAFGTVIGQIMAMCYLITIYLKKTNCLDISMKNFRPKLKICLDIIKLGVPLFAQELFTSLSSLFFNGLFASYSLAAVAIYGICFRLQQFLFLLVIGLALGGVPILAYNFGAKNKERFLKCLKYMLSTSAIMMFIGLILFNVFTDLILALFSAEAELLSMGRYAIRFISYAFVFVGINTILIMTFQSIGKPVYAFLMTFCRVLFFSISIAWIFSNLFGVHAVWLCYAVAEGFCLVIFTPLAYKEFMNF